MVAKIKLTKKISVVITNVAFFPIIFINIAIEAIQIAVEVTEKPAAVPRPIIPCIRKGRIRIISVPPQKYTGIPISKMITVPKILSTCAKETSSVIPNNSIATFTKPAKKHAKTIIM